MNGCRPQRALLAEGSCCKVERCDCGTIHVSLGAITLRLRRDAVESVWFTLGEALGRLPVMSAGRVDARHRLS